MIISKLNEGIAIQKRLVLYNEVLDKIQSIDYTPTLNFVKNDNSDRVIEAELKPIIGSTDVYDVVNTAKADIITLLETKISGLEADFAALTAS